MTHGNDPTSSQVKVLKREYLLALGWWKGTHQRRHGMLPNGAIDPRRGYPTETVAISYSGMTITTALIKASSAPPLAGNGDLVRQSRGRCHLSVDGVEPTRYFDAHHLIKEGEKKTKMGTDHQDRTHEAVGGSQ